MAEIVLYDKQEVPFIRIDEAPYTVAKVVRFKDAVTAIDFKAKQVNYVIKQVPGFRIFLVHAGFVNKPEKQIPEEIVEKQIDEMISWYSENKTSNKRTKNYYQIK